MTRSWSLVVGWIAVLVLGVGAGHALGAGVLAVPGVEVAAWRAWSVTTDPLVAVMALLRVVALTVGWYLLVTTALGVAARMLHAVRLVHLADRISAPFVRRILQRGMGVMVATALVTSVSAAPAQAAAPPQAVLLGERTTVTMRGVTPSLEDPVADAAGEPTPPWQRFLRSSEPVAADPAGPESAVPEPVAPRQAALDVADQTHTVRAGESLWRIAETQLAAVLGRAPGDTEIVPYWRDLIERNRDRLVVPDDPDLIVPGQELLLPAVGRS
jgi:LysM repeat protein